MNHQSLQGRPGNKQVRAANFHFNPRPSSEQKEPFLALLQLKSLEPQCRT